jgi:hypothetical protein
MVLERKNPIDIGVQIANNYNNIPHDRKMTNIYGFYESYFLSLKSNYIILYKFIGYEYIIISYNSL